jgi:SsrA-binding protein
MGEPETKALVTNRKASFEYFLDDRFEAGIALVGSEVKSLRAGKANLLEAWVDLDPRGAWLVGCHISPYEQANRFNHEPMRRRQLLLNRSELNKLTKAVRERGRTIVPVRLYLKGSRIKVEIAVATGKKAHDKRHAIKERDARRELREA